MTRFFLPAWAALCVLSPARLARAETVIQDFRSRRGFDAFWGVSAWGDADKQYSAANVVLDTARGWVRLKVNASPPGTKPVCGEISSKRSDFRYGSYRASLKFDSVPGAVAGWFVYKDVPDLNEIDVEFLTRDTKHVHYTLHHIQTNVDYRKDALDFDPTAAFHEYRFDWHPDKVVYYIDGLRRDSLKVKVPDAAVAIMLNFWSANLPGWGGPAPTRDAYMYVNQVRYDSDYEVALLRPRAGARPRAAIGPVQDGSARYRCDGKSLAARGTVHRWGGIAFPPPGDAPGRQLRNP